MDQLYLYKDIINVVSQFLTHVDIKNLMLVKKCDIFDIFLKKCCRDITVEDLIRNQARNIVNAIPLIEFKNITMGLACENGHLEIVKYLYSIGNSYTRVGMDLAAQNGHLEVVKFLYSVGIRHTILAMNRAAENGHLEVVKFLYSIGTRRKKTAINWAAENGHLEVVKFLYHIHSSGDFMKKVMNYASRNGHLEIVKFLYSVGRCTSYAMNCACRNDHIEVVKFLHSVGEYCKYFTLAYASRKRHLYVMKYLFRYIR